MSEETNHFATPFGTCWLQRYPLRRKETLRAWDAADAYLLEHLADQGLLKLGSNILIFNDPFGAVSIPLSRYRPTVQSDSYIAHWSIGENLLQNASVPEALTLLSSTTPLPDLPCDLALIRIPKTLALLEEQLLGLKGRLSGQAQVIGYAMARQIHSSTLALFESIIGPTRTSLARKKARLIFSVPDAAIPPKASPYPTWFKLEEYQLRVCAHANVFSRERLDIGTRLFIQHIPSHERYREIADLGCGSGIIGVLAGRLNPQAKIHFVDESFMAVASAQATAAAAQLTNETVFVVGDGLRDYSQQSLDLVLCNPPFHQQQVVGDLIAWRMFQQARQALRRGGELWIVGNRHLNYHGKLKRLFGNTAIVASNAKFVVLKATKR